MYAVMISAVVFFGVLLASAFLYWGGVSRREAERLELARRLGPGQAQLNILRVREIDVVGERLGKPGRWLHNLTLRAGAPQDVGRLLAVCAVYGVLGVILLGLLVKGTAALVGAAAAGLPILVLLRRATARNKEMSSQLPDALDLMCRALRAGHSFPDALRLAADEIPQPLSLELAHTSEEHRLGLELRACLEGLAERLPNNFEVRMFASSVLLQRETGGNLIEMLEHLANTVRERIVFEGKVKALTAEVRASATILELLPGFAAFLLWLAEPTYLLPLFQPGLGRTLAIGAVASMITGILVMRRVAHVEI